MKNIKILSLLLIGTLTLGALGGCSMNKTSSTSTSSAIESIQPEDGHTLAIAENTIIPNFVVSRYSNFEKLTDDYVTATNLFANDKINQDFIDKYGYQDVVKKGTYSPKDVYNVNPDFYNGLSTFLCMNTMDGFKRTDLEKSYISQIQNYLEDTLTNKSSSGYTLSEDFSALKPKETVQNYLKKNKIEITNVVYPNDAVCQDFAGAGTYMITVDVKIEGTKNGEKFEDTLRYDFHFVMPKDIREGADLRYSTTEGEIMSVTNSFCDESTNHYDYKKIEDYYKNLKK